MGNPMQKLPLYNMSVFSRNILDKDLNLQNVGDCNAYSKPWKAQVNIYYRFCCSLVEKSSSIINMRIHDPTRLLKRSLPQMPQI